MKMKSMNETITFPSNVAEKYLSYPRKVLSGEIIACNSIKRQCMRYLSWFSRDDMYFSPKSCDKVVNFVQRFKLSSCGNKQFKLTECQKHIVYSIYGFKWKKNGLRVVKECYIQVARKFGKDQFTTALALYHLIADGKHDFSGVFVANSYSQAMIAFKYCRGLIQSIDPSKRFIKTLRDSITFLPKNGELKTLSSDASKLDGLNLDLAIIDERHAAKTNDIYNVIATAMAAKPEALLISITTAGLNMSVPCYDVYKMSKDILNGNVENDTFMPIIYELDDIEEADDESCWIKAQPHLGVTTTYDYYRNEHLKAKTLPSTWNNFLVKVLDMWTSNGTDQWLNEKYIAEVADKVDVDELAKQGYQGYLSFDSASVSELTCLCLMIPTEEKIYYKCWYYLPSSALEESANRELYKDWSRRGYLTVTQGNVTDLDYLEKDIKNICNKFQIVKICYDQWCSSGVVTKLYEQGFPVKPFSQSMASMSAPTKQLEIDIKSNKVVIDNNPITLFCLRNGVAKYDDNENIKIVKETNENKIDGLISIIMNCGGYYSDTHYDNTVTFLEY